MNQIIDQVEIQNHHGQISGDQIELLLKHVIFEEHMLGFSDVTVQTVRDNPLIRELADELREAHGPEEMNFIRAQIMVLKCKDIYTAVQHPDDWMAPVPYPAAGGGCVVSTGAQALAQEMILAPLNSTYQPPSGNLNSASVDMMRPTTYVIKESSNFGDQMAGSLPQGLKEPVHEAPPSSNLKTKIKQEQDGTVTAKKRGTAE
ncbi:unnamed protein product [Caenorhabditis brenneri]